MMTKQAIEVEPGLKYTEETGRVHPIMPVRDCFLWQEGVDEPVSGLNVFSFRQRFGVVSVPAEGIGGVETIPEFRRRGYMSIVMGQALEGVARRAKVAFVSDAVEDVYEKFGFVTCCPDAYLSIPVRNVERMAGGMEPDFNDEGAASFGGSGAASFSGSVRAFSPDDLPAMVNLYNEEHARRPWTLEREATWNGLVPERTWRPGSEVVILEGDEGLAGYAIYTRQPFGHTVSPFVVDELAARNVKVALALLVEVAKRCWQLRFNAFQVHEPLDSTVGRAAQELGCDYVQAFPPSGRMMGAILDRPGLLSLLEPELRRRLPSDGLSSAHAEVFDALCQGELLPDNSMLLQLLLGYRSSDDALAHGAVIPVEYRSVCAAWFPGGGTRSLPLPYAHHLDRY